MFYLLNKIKKNTKSLKKKKKHTHFRQQKVPDWDDVREKYDKTEKVAEPWTHKTLQCNHDNGQNHLGQEQGLGEPVQFQVQKADLSGSREWKEINFHFTFNKRETKVLFNLQRFT